jgi:hypothetical protein
MLPAREEDVQKADASLAAAMSELAKAAADRLKFVKQMGTLLAQLAGEASRAEPAVMEYLGKRGWHVDYGFPLVCFSQIEKLIVAGHHAKVDEVMSGIICGEFDAVENKVCKRFPDRETIVRDAFEAHRQAKYTLSIPTLLPQIDGIGRETLGMSTNQFFRQWARQEAIEAKLAPQVGAGSSLLKQIVKKSSMEETTRDRNNLQEKDPWFGPLNRHGVIHGVDTDYPSEANSLRCVLLLAYLLDVDEFLHKRLPNQQARLRESDLRYEEMLARLPSELAVVAAQCVAG